MIKYRHIIESEYGGVATVRDVAFLTASYPLPGQEPVRNRLVEVSELRQLLSGCESVALTLADKGEIGHTFHRRIRHQIV